MDISGNVVNDIQDLNIFIISLSLSVFHFDKSGKVFKEVQFSNKLAKDLILLVFHVEILGIEVNDLQL